MKAPGRVLPLLLLIAACGGTGGTAAPPQQLPTPTGFAFENGFVVVPESASHARVEVRRSGDGKGPAEIELSLTAVSAEAGSDYTAPAPAVRLRWDDGGLGTLAAMIPILADDDAEADESFEVSIVLLDPSHGVGTPSTAVVIIEDDDPFPLTDPVLAVTEGNDLIGFDSGDPSMILFSVPISGTQASETIVAIDVRPADNLLYGLGSKDRLYVIDAVTGVATAVRPTPLTISVASLPAGLDFDPLLDRLRIVGIADENFRVRPANAVIDQVDTALRYFDGDLHFEADPQICAIAYARRGVGPHDPQVYGIDAALDVLVTIGTVISSPPPDTGFLYTIGPLGFDTDTTAGFDIGPSGRAYACLTPPGAALSILALVDLETGTATAIAPIAASRKILSLTVSLRN